MVIDFRKWRIVPNDVSINGIAVEKVDDYKYLGVVFNSQFSWHNHIDMVMKQRKKLKSRMYCLRAMNMFHVNKKS